jgi:hypothetical protein
MGQRQWPSQWALESIALEALGDELVPALGKRIVDVPEEDRREDDALS